MTFGKMTFGKMTFGKMTFGKMTFGKNDYWSNMNQPNDNRTKKSTHAAVSQACFTLGRQEKGIQGGGSSFTQL